MLLLRFWLSKGHEDLLRYSTSWLRQHANCLKKLQFSFSRFSFVCLQCEKGSRSTLSLRWCKNIIATCVLLNRQQATQQLGAAQTGSLTHCQIVQVVVRVRLWVLKTADGSVPLWLSCLKQRVHYPPDRQAIHLHLDTHFFYTSIHFTLIYSTSFLLVTRVLFLLLFFCLSEIPDIKCL